MGWIKHSEDTNMPKWLKDNLPAKCKCGTEKENFYNVDGKCTARRCPNKECPWTLAQRIAAMCDILNVQGIGDGKGLQLVQDYKLKSHFEAIPYIFKEKPTIQLYQLLRISFIEGVDTRWEQACSKFSSVDEFYTNYRGPLKDILHDNLELVKYGETFFNIQKYEAQQFKALIRGTVMLSGHFRGFQDRDNFIRGINYASQGLIELGISQNKRKTGIMCLIQEKDEPMRGKAECALEAGIPIMSPDEFKAYIMDLLRKKLEEIK